MLALASPHAFPHAFPISLAAYLIPHSSFLIPHISYLISHRLFLCFPLLVFSSSSLSLEFDYEMIMIVCFLVNDRG